MPRLLGDSILLCANQPNLKQATRIPAPRRSRTRLPHDSSGVGTLNPSEAHRTVRGAPEKTVIVASLAQSYHGFPDTITSRRTDLLYFIMGGTNVLRSRLARSGLEAA